MLEVAELDAIALAGDTDHARIARNQVELRDALRQVADEIVAQPP